MHRPQLNQQMFPSKSEIIWTWSKMIIIICHSSVVRKVEGIFPSFLWIICDGSVIVSLIEEIEAIENIIFVSVVGRS